MSATVEFTNNMEAFAAAFEKQVRKGMNAIGLTAAKHAKKNCPVDTGRLRNSITYATVWRSNVEYSYSYEDRDAPIEFHSSGMGFRPTSLTPTKKKKARTSETSHVGGVSDDSIWIGTNVEYAAVQEYGDHLHHEKGGQAHFLRDAATTHNKEYEDIMVSAMKDYVFQAHI